MWVAFGLGIGVFLAAAALDYSTGRYLLAVSDRRVHRAAMWSVLMALLSTAGLLSVVDVSKWYILPECLGLYAGTWLSFKRG
jgi:hypothetical protein